MGSPHKLSIFGIVLLVLSSLPSSFSSTTTQFTFNVEWKNVERLCHTRKVLTINGEYPGPTIIVHEGDNVEVKVTNRVARNTTLHWHGVRQIRTAWADGPAYITQCPIGHGGSYTYKFKIINQRGTLWWHAHLGWQRSSVHGAFVIYPRLPYPFSIKIQRDIPIIFGEWWNGDVEAIENDMMLYGSGPNSSDAYTINGLPGPLIINAALNDELFFAVANHTLTVVEIDAVYTKPFTTTAIMVAPGQTTNVLLTANQDPRGPNGGAFVMAARPYLTSVPKKMDRRVITTISLNLQDCPANETCKGYRNKKFYASMNNQSFVRQHSMSILESHYRNVSTSLFSPNFPENPPHPFNYTGVDPVAENMNTGFGTRLLVVPFGTRLEMVLQDTNFLNPENHPIHIHGHNFFIVGRGFGNFDVAKDPAGYNLVDPPERNTVAVPVGGWAAIRLVADNPGVWFIHCHLEEHTTWGLAMGLVVNGGQHPSQCLLPPPNDLPSC
nr:laccase-1 [Ipomoea trifida]